MQYFNNYYSMQQPPAFLQHMEHFKPQMINMSQEQVQSTNIFNCKDTETSLLFMFLVATFYLIL